MQFKLLATFLLSSAALASASEATITGSSDSFETNPDSSSLALPKIPHSILTALETAVPPSWFTDMMKPQFRSSVESEAQAGTMPAWYNALPSSVKAWASSEGAMLNGFLGSEQTSAVVGATSSNAPATGVPAHNTASTMSTTMSTAAANKTGASGTKKSTPSSSTSTSTGGAPIATGGVAASIAGAAGILGLALAL
ncbi:hypothetical protein N7474_004044 [Penicillium riverlandense]|uniref:uncharacterized protein n=1 Tax=Penicillium riverlandense TaxID=1903569 RepID=UPI0025467340|nr:uncharacterized protein N7474_004044 [Penicillium riverlandense]KAJ5818453.1 hypothetical protein N7474_004044 [Penicillium riverlandense]